jgi:O-antigen/teichoic acid export membrane protein
VNVRLSNVKKNLFANFFGIGVLLFSQVILVPVYLHFWGVEMYSDWIILTAISSFFAMSDVGLNSVTINRFVIKKEEGEINECQSLLINNFLLVIAAFTVSISGAIVYLIKFDVVSSLGLHVINRETASYTFIILIGYIFLGMASSVLDAIYRAYSFNHKAIHLGNIVRFAEGLVVLVALILNFSIILLAALFLIPRILIFVYKLIDIKKYFPYQLSFKSKDWKLFKELLYPSFTFMFFPIGNGIVFQGFSLLVNKYFGADSLVLYNSTRTLTSFLNQILSTVLQAVWPEFSIAYGKKDVQRMRELHRKAFAVATSGAIVLGLLLLLFGEIIFIIWTQRKIEFDFSLMLAFLVVLIFRSIWSTSSVALMATNRHSRIGILYIILAALSITTAVASTQFYYSLVVTVYCLLIIEIGLSLYALRQGLKITQDSFTGLIIASTGLIATYKSKISSFYS